ncbi:cyclin-dependent kinase inhibitor 3 family protein [Neptunomonas antarctica]|uniref:Dual specificity phosphatase, catalytic domain n=1 Tax=Neptunomonas antarctica TaxID=619304 RepID=A0A1N7NTW5_9GAMM|nr:cyclin-dependent kinase inhibitor 3 family protein [Neptunomonas antarctica]SIT01803.1 Dual specificity phosphatase, catalytic domain [Neptunomonas antarctica]
MSHPFDALSFGNGAKFIFTACPGTQDEDLVASLTTLKAVGTSAVVSLLSDTEIGVLGVTGLGEEISRQGLAWYQLPIEDDCAPGDDFFEAFALVKTELLDKMNRGETIVIHCKGGSGRTGLMAAILLLENGDSWSDIIAQVQSLRPKALTLPHHLNFIHTHYSI